MLEGSRGIALCAGAVLNGEALSWEVEVPGRTDRSVEEIVPRKLLVVDGT
jgi:hypothetical protein